MFHFNRMIGITEGLKSGQFPVRIEPQVYYGAGYQAPLYYPDLFLYLPGILMLLGMPLLPAVYCFMFLINLGIVGFAYLSMKRLGAGTFASLIFAVAYLFSPYLVSDLHSRFALGETLALIFFPLVIAGFYEAVLSEKHGFLLLTFGMSGIILSHILSTLFALSLLLLLSLFFCDRLFTSLRALLSVFISAALSFGLCVFFLVPFLQADRTNTMVNTLIRFPWESSITLEKLMLPVTLADNQVFFLGWCVYPAVILSIFVLIRKEKGVLERRLIISLLILGLFYAFVCTSAFPWQKLMTVSPLFEKVFSMIQFPWRFVGLCSLCFLMAGGIALSALPFRKTGRIVTLITALVLSFSSFIPYCISFSKNHEIVLQRGGDT